MGYDYDVTSVSPYGMDNKEKESKKEQVNSSIRNYEWAADDYDRRYGKGSYFKKFPETKAILDQLYEEKQECMNKVAMEALKDADSNESLENEI